MSTATQPTLRIVSSRPSRRAGTATDRASGHLNQGPGRAGTVERPDPARAMSDRKNRRRRHVREFGSPVAREWPNEWQRESTEPQFTLHRAE